MRALGRLVVAAVWVYHVVQQAWYGVAAAVIGSALLRGAYLAMGEGDSGGVWFLGTFAVALLGVSFLAIRRAVREVARMNAKREQRY